MILTSSHDSGDAPRPPERGRVAGISISCGVLALLLFPARTGADDTRARSSTSPPHPDVIWSGTETLSAEYVGDNGPLGEGAYGDDDDFWTFRNLFYLQARSADFETGLRFDATLFHNPPHNIPLDEFAWGEEASGYTLLNFHRDFRVERVYGTIRSGDLSVTLGDFHVTLGRGIALALIKVDDVGLDTSLLGARVAYRWQNLLTVTGLGGVVNGLNVDPVTRHVYVDDPLDRVAAARIEWAAHRALGLALHGVLVRPRFTKEEHIPEDRLYVDRSPGVAARNVGASADLRVGSMTLYLEADYQRHDNYRPPPDLEDVMNESGRAFLAELGVAMGNHEIRLEGYAYRQWLMDGPYRGSSSNLAVTQPIPYQKMVTLELGWMPLKSLGNADAARLSWHAFSPGTGTALIVRTLAVSNRGGLTPQGAWFDHRDIRSLHPTLEIEKTFQTSRFRIILEGGYRHEWMTGDNSGQGYLWHGSASATIPLVRSHSLVAESGVRRHHLDLTEGPAPYWVIATGLGYHLSGLLSVTLLHEYCDQIDRTEAKLGDWNLPLADHHYASITLSAYPPRPLDGLSLGVSAGSQRGGHKCAGGVCREFPDSVGAKIEATYRF